MSMMSRVALCSLVLTAGAVSESVAQPGTMPAPSSPSALPPPQPLPPPTDAAPPADPKAPKQPKRGDFDAGGQVRLPSGPDEMGQFATFNWIALDVKGQYLLLDSVSVKGNIPLAVKTPEMTPQGVDPKLVGGMTVTLEAKLPKFEKLPFAKQREGTEVGLSLTGAYMREGAMLLSTKDFPLFTGDFQPGFAGALITKVKLSTLVDFSLLPAWVYQSGSMESLTAVQIPMSLILRVGSLAQLSADTGIYTGDDYSFSGSKGGRISAGGSLTVKIGPVLAHAGAGVASLLTGGLYPTVGDSVYVDLNVKYAK